MIRDFCFLDLETTGFEPKKDSIIELSFVREKNGKSLQEVDQVLIPDKAGLNDFVTHLTGITQEEIDRTGVVLKSIKDTVSEKIGDSIIVGHNIDFDINFLIENGIDLEKNPRIDTHELARILLPREPSFALEILTKNYGFAHENAHRAMSDVLASKDLFHLLEERIAALPDDFLEKIVQVLEHKTDWYARHLFLASKKESSNQNLSLDFSTEKIPSTQNSSSVEPVEIPEQGACILIKNNQTAVHKFLATAKKEVSDGNKVFIVSPKIDYFPNEEKFPTPEVIFDPQKLPQFLAARGTLDNAEATFYVKCAYRDYLGHRGLFFFDLFFKENQYWQEVSMDEASDLYASVLEEKKDIPILVLSPQAFLRFMDRKEFQGRTCLIDETELFTRDLLYAGSKTLSLRPYLESPNPGVANTAQFLISGFVKDVLEVRLGHESGGFPQRLLLDEKDSFPQMAEALKTLLPEKDFSWATILETPEPNTVRWVYYIPDSGNLSFGVWSPVAWEESKKNLKNFKKLWALRTPLSKDFFETFLGCSDVPGITVIEPEKPVLHVPENLVSVKSPDFNDFCVQYILEKIAQNTGNIAVNFSSIDTLRRVFEKCSKALSQQEDVFLVGERVNGGGGKVRGLMESHKNKRIIFFFQKAHHPALESYEWETLIFQKFPFAPPHPLLDHLEQRLKQDGKNFWSLWIMSHLSAEISRRLGNFAPPKNIYWLDPRENSRWGKSVLEEIFRS